jgi:accessory gene regulator B
MKVQMQTWRRWMMLFKKWATGLAEKLMRMAGETDTYKIALVRYRLECLFSMVLSIGALFVLALVLGILKTAFLIACTGVIIKNFTGGLHLGTPLRCAICGALFIIGLSYIAIYFPMQRFPSYLVLAVLIFLNIIVWWKAPHETEAKPLTGNQKKYLAIFSRILLLLLSIICWIWPNAWGVNELFYGIVFQVINLLTVSARGMERLDGFLEKIEQKPIF